jgi:hypothetical protein
MKAGGVPNRTIDAATSVLREGVPELAKAVEKGHMAVSSAGGLYALCDIYLAADENAA